MMLMELYEVIDLPMIDMETGKRVDGDVVLNNPFAKVKRVSCDGKYNILVKYEKEPKDAENV